MNTISIEEGQELQLDFSKIQKIFRLNHHVIPAVVQDARTKDVLIVGYINAEAFDVSVNTGCVTLWSTSRNQLWEKGKTSGDSLDIQDIRVNCEQNSVLFLVKPKGIGACHTKNQKGQSRKSCFYRRVVNGKLELLEL